jgi:hypothetical protein
MLAVQRSPGMELGRGRPHSEMALALKGRSGAADETPALAALAAVGERVFSAVSLQWAFGDLDQLRREEQSKRRG